MTIVVAVHIQNMKYSGVFTMVAMQLIFKDLWFFLMFGSPLMSQGDIIIFHVIVTVFVIYLQIL